MSTLEVSVSRRTVLAGAGASLVVAGTTSLAPGKAQAALKAGPGSPVATYKIGDFTVSTLLDGAVSVGDPQKTFGMNVEASTFQSISEENFIPADRFKAYFTPTVVDTGSEVVLFDTGVGENGRPARGNMRAALASAGYAPEQIGVVVLTHMHPDHIGGLMEGGAPTFPNARYVIGAVEHNFWSKMDPEANGVTKLFTRNVAPLADKMTFLDDGGSVASGITAVAAFGHTPGHMTYMLESNGQQLLLAADTANHYVWSLAHPDWEVRFDMDKEAAANTRRSVFDRLAADRIPFVGYHMPFPATGFVDKAGSGFRYVAASYQFSL